MILRTGFRHLAMVCALLLCAGMLGSLVGCQSPLFNPDNRLAQQITVQYATGKFIEAAGTAGARASRAADVKSVAESVRKVAASDSASIGALSQLAMAKVAAAKLTPADRLLAQALVAAVTDELSKRVAGGVLDADARVAVGRLLDWVSAAADAYAPGAV